MYFGPRKLLFSQVRLHKAARILSEEMCTDDCKNSSLLSPPPPSPRQIPKNNLPLFFILMLCSLSVAFLFFCCLNMLRRYRWNRSNSSRRIFSSFAGGSGAAGDFVNENQGPFWDHPIWYIRSVGLEQSVIDSIPIFKYKKGEEGLVEGTDCGVCLNEFEEDECLRLLTKCSHAFHITCIDTWLRSHKNCPLCRAAVVHDVNAATTADTSTDLVNTGQSVLEDATRIDDVQQQGNGEDGESELRISFFNHGVSVEKELQLQQPVRRSFSMDLSSPSQIHAEEGCSILQELEVKKQNSEMAAGKLGNKNSSRTGSRNRFSFGMKRSVSVSCEMPLHRNSRSEAGADATLREAELQQHR